MIRLGDKTILVLFPDGRSVPFDPQELRCRLESCLAGSVAQEELAIAQDIALAVEFALFARNPGSGAAGAPLPCVKAEALDALTMRLLQNAGCPAAAARYQRETGRYGCRGAVPMSQISALLADEFQLRDSELERISQKVFHTLQSIGAENTFNAPLVLELAKHFRKISTGTVPVNIRIPDMAQDKMCTVLPEELLAEIPEQTRNYFRNRVLKIHPVNLKILPVLRIDLRLTGLAGQEGLAAPLTELVLAPGFVRAARAVDGLCLAADKIFAAHGNAADTPVKILVHIVDASVFTREWMGCITPEAQTEYAAELGRAFALELTRVPVKLTCG